MDASASLFRSSRILAITALAAGSVFVNSGCGNSKAASAQEPPPPTLSEPVRPIESRPSLAPVIPVSTTTEDQAAHAAQKTGESRELPTFLPPPAKPAPVAAAASVPTPGDKNGKYHTLAKGETIFALSRLYNVKAKQIIEANNFKDPNHLAIGTKVYIPIN